MYANRSVFIIEQVRQALDQNALFNVTKVHRPKFGTNVNCYPYIVQQRTNYTLEDGAGDSIGTVTIGILFDANVSSDTQGAGLGTDKYGEIVQACEDAFANWEMDVLSDKPSDEHTGALFKTIITGVSFIGWDGHWDNGANTIAIGCQIEVNYMHISL
jgi:hypothetical protein